MKIKDLLIENPKKATIAYLDDCAEIRINQFAALAGKPSEYPQIVVSEYQKHFEKIDKEWSSAVKHSILHGRKSKRIFLQSIKKFKIDTFIEEELKYKIHHSKYSFTRMKYSYYNFFELSKMQLAMLLYKYGDELMYFELRVAVLELLLFYFNLYSQYDNYGPFPERTWIIQSGEIEKCLNDLFILSTEDLKPYMDYIDTKYKVQIQTRFDDDVFKRHLRPKSKEELMTILKEGMSQAEINGAIQDYWEVGERTARTWMRQFGLTRKYRSRNQDLDDAITTDVSLKESGQTGVSNAQLDVLSQKINEQKSQIINLQA